MSRMINHNVACIDCLLFFKDNKVFIIIIKFEHNDIPYLVFPSQQVNDTHCHMHNNTMIIIVSL